MGRFTEQSQIEAFQDFLEQQETGLGANFDSLNNAVATANENLEWNQNYMTDFVDYLHELNSAPVKLISISLAALALLCLYVLN